MENKTNIDDISLDKLTWSKEEFTLSDFVDKFTLPQIVKVQEGYYGPDEDSCLGADQILFLHVLKHTEKVQARDVRKRELHIPMNCSQRIEIRPSNLREVYEGVAELAELFTRRKYPLFVRVTQGYNSIEDDNLCLNPGDKLRLLEVVNKAKEQFLKVEVQDGSGSNLCIPFTACAQFQPLSDGREYYIKEIASSTKMPFFFQFIKPFMVTDTGEASVFNLTLGVLRAEKTYHDSSVVCTTQEGQVKTVVTCPKTLQITVTAASGALVGDQEYMRICKFFHDGISLKRIENMECFNVFASRDTIREYIYDTPRIPSSPSENVPSIQDTIHGDAKSNDDISIGRFDYEKFKSTFDSTTSECDDNQSNEGDTYEDMNDQIVQKTSKPLLYLEKPDPPPVKPKPKDRGTYKDLDNNNSSPTPKPQIEQSKDTKEGSQEQKVSEINTTASSQGSSKENEIENMSVGEVALFLERHNLSEFKDIFTYNQVDGDMLMSMDAEMMEALGMNKFQQKKLLKLVQGWRPKC